MENPVVSENATCSEKPICALCNVGAFHDSVSFLYTTSLNLDVLLLGLKAHIARDFPFSDLAINFGKCCCHADSGTLRAHSGAHLSEHSCHTAGELMTLDYCMFNGNRTSFCVASGVNGSTRTLSEMGCSAVDTLNTCACHGVHHPAGTDESGDKLSKCPCAVQRRLIVLGLTGNAHKDRRLLKAARKTVLQPTDIIVLVTCYEEAVKQKYLKVPGMILNSSIKAEEYNITIVSQLMQRLRLLALRYLPGFHTYPLIVPTANTTKPSVGNLLCRVSTELKAAAVVLGSKGHTSIRQVLFGSVSRYVRNHAPCQLIVPRVGVA